MLRSKEAFYSIKWDFRDWENILEKNISHHLRSIGNRVKCLVLHQKFLKYDQVL